MLFQFPCSGTGPPGVSRRQAILTAASVAFIPCVSLHADDDLASTPEFEPRLSFAAAAEPYRHAAYARDGYVDRSGKIRGNGLGCSAYASVVLHRMRDGEDWLSQYDLTVHQKYGDEVASHFGLRQAATIPAATLSDPKAVKSLQDEQTLQPGMLYLFNVRRDEQGHVGFVRVNADGTLTQSHYSGLKSINGLATGNFAKWLSVSQYSRCDVQLYPVLANESAQSRKN